MNDMIARLIRLFPEAPAGGNGTATPPAGIVTPPVTTPPGGKPEVLGGAVVDKSMQPSVLDLDASVMVGGKKVSVRELAASHERVGTLEQQVKESDDAIRRLYGKAQNDTPEEFEESAKALRWARMRAGYTKEEVDAEVAELRTKAGLDPNPADKQIDIDNHPTIIQNQRVTQSLLKNFSTQAIQAAMTTTTELKGLVDKVREMNGDDDAKAIAKSIDESLRREVGKIVKERMTRAGGILEDVEWINEAMAAAVPAVVKQFGPHLRLVAQVGRGSSAEPNFLDGLPEKPVARPTPDFNQPASVNETNLMEWITDKLSRAAHEAVSGSPG